MSKKKNLDFTQKSNKPLTFHIIDKRKRHQPTQLKSYLTRMS